MASKNLLGTFKQEHLWRMNPLIYGYFLKVKYQGNVFL